MILPGSTKLEKIKRKIIPGFKDPVGIFTALHTPN
jgi:hypothetical protein